MGDGTAPVFEPLFRSPHTDIHRAPYLFPEALNRTCAPDFINLQFPAYRDIQWLPMPRSSRAFLFLVFCNRRHHRRLTSNGEEAVYSYTEYLAGVDNGAYANVPAPQIAIDYRKLAPDARSRDVIVAVRADETHHRDVNHKFAGALA